MLSPKTFSAHLYRLADWLQLHDGHSASRSIEPSHFAGGLMFAAADQSSSANPQLRGPRQTTARRPLRVVRVLDGEQSRGNTGRIVISGSIADVCAELDRLTQA